jgi:hypothetical protein
VTLELTWTTETYVDSDALLRALESTIRALDLGCSVWVEPPDEDHAYEERPASAVVVHTGDGDTDDGVELEVAGPVPIRARLVFTGYDLVLAEAETATDWERAYLFAQHAAILLGMAPQAELDEQSDYVDEIKSHVEISLGAELERVDRADEEPTLEVETTAGSVGALRFDAHHDNDKLVIDVRGAGTDVRCRIAGLAPPLDEAGLRDLLEELASEPPVDITDEERSIRLAGTEPPRSPENAGKLVAIRWIDGLPAAPREIGVDDVLGSLVDDGGFCDIVRYLSDGQPALRCVPMWARPDSRVSSALDEPSWVWAPKLAAEVLETFARITRVAREGYVPNAEPAGGPLTLGRWLEAFSRVTGRLEGLTASRLLRADANDGAELDDWRASSPIGRGDVALILGRISDLAATGSLAEHAGFLASGEWENDSTDRFVETLVELLGLPEAPRPAEPAPYDAYLATLNGAAALMGTEERLYVVPNTDGLTLVIKLLPAQLDALRAEGLIEAHLPAGPGPVRPGVWEQMRGWWSKRSS